MSLGSHQSARMKTDEWLTPPEIIEALGPFDLDPCSPIERPWDTAGTHFHKSDCGLSKNWFGRVWLNPPYGREAIRWMRRMVMHTRGTALLPARTETKLFFETVWPYARGILFMKGRPHFYSVDGTRAKGNSGAPICLIAYGNYDAGVLRESSIEGKYFDM